jgi:hypothetical protein
MVEAWRSPPRGGTNVRASAILIVWSCAVGCATSGSGSDTFDEGTAGLGGAGGATGGMGGTSNGAAPAVGGGGQGGSGNEGGAGSTGGVGGSGAEGGGGSATGGMGGGGSGTGGASPCPDPPTGPIGCSGCSLICSEVWPVTWTGSAGATHYIVTYHCAISNPTYSTMGTTVDLCTNMNMCDDAACAFGAGAVTVEACNASCCSAPVTFPDTPSACGGGICC